MEGGGGGGRVSRRTRFDAHVAAAVIGRAVDRPPDRPVPLRLPPPAAARYDRATGDIKLTCDRFPTREENRRWCLEALHRLVAEGNRVDPSPTFLFGAGAGAGGVGRAASPFL